MHDVVTSSALRALLLSSSGQPLLQQRKDCSVCATFAEKVRSPAKSGRMR